MIAFMFYITILLIFSLGLILLITGITGYDFYKNYPKWLDYVSIFGILRQAKAISRLYFIVFGLVLMALAVYIFYFAIYGS